MAGAFSDYYEAAILNWFCGTTFPSVPANVYVALYTALPADTGTSGSPTAGTEPSGNNYARVAVPTNTSVGWNSPTASGTTQQISNKNTVTFNQATGSWGTIVGYGVYDAITSGNLLFYGAISPTQTIGANMTPSFAAGQIVFSVD